MFPIDRENDTAHSFVIFGVSGYLASRVVMPQLFELYRRQLLPQNTKIYGFARKRIHKTSYRVNTSKFFDWDFNKEERIVANFWSAFELIQGDCNVLADFVNLVARMVQSETHRNGKSANRIFYLAVPPIALDAVTTNIFRKCLSSTGWNRIVVEKPFARNETTYRVFQMQLSQMFSENQIYMIDHHLSKQSIQNYFAWRFSNFIYNSTWNNQTIASVLISFKDTVGVGRRGKYFNGQGIIRELVQNHMMHILAFLAMEHPYSNDIEHIRDECVKVLRATKTVEISDVVLGQYVRDMNDPNIGKVGYTDEIDVPADSLRPTYALIVMHIENQRWSGVPFILRCGIGMNVCESVVRVQYKEVEPNIFDSHSQGNELFIHLQPKEEMIMYMNAKTPSDRPAYFEQTSKRMSDRRFKHFECQNTFGSLLLDVFNGFQLMFMRSDEVCESWRILTPLLAKIKLDRVKPFRYPRGSRGPLMGYIKAEAAGFKFFNAERPEM